MNAHSLCMLPLLLWLANADHHFGPQGVPVADSQRSRRAAVLDGGNFVVVDGSVNVVNGKVISGEGCYYHDGKVTDNGKTRAMSGSERAKLKQYMSDLHKATVRFEQEMQRMFAPPFPWGPYIGPPPQLRMPQVPCFCSAASCAKVVENKTAAADE